MTLLPSCVVCLWTQPRRGLLTPQPAAVDLDTPRLVALSGRSIGCPSFGLALEAREQRLRRSEAAARLRGGAPLQLLQQRGTAVAVRGIRVLVAELGEGARRDRGH